MKTDSLFYQLFQRTPGLFFELIGREANPNYRFDSVEVKQTAFRIDGVFLPSSTSEPVYFVEVQFYEDDELYLRLFGEIFLFLRHHRENRRWRGVVIFAGRNLEPDPDEAYQVLLESHHVQRFYLGDDLPEGEETSLNLRVLKLVVEPQTSAPQKARQLLNEVQSEPNARTLIELIETIMVYKFPLLSRQEIAEMLGIANSLKETRFYQEVHQEGREDEARSLILKLLTRRLGAISDLTREQIEQLSLAQLEILGEALLDFGDRSDLETWLESQQS